MCASYGLDPRAGDHTSLLQVNDREVLEALEKSAQRNDGGIIRRRGKSLRNLNPVIRERDGGRRTELTWRGYLVDGEPSRFPSINTRSERLQERPAGAIGRALVPATSWLEMQKPSRDWYSLGTGEAFAMAAVLAAGRELVAQVRATRVAR